MGKNGLFTRLNELKKEINNLRDSLNKINREKEFWFHKKESLKKDISKFVGEIKNIKHSKDSANVEIKKLRDSRDSYNKNVRELITKIKTLNKNKIDFIKKNKVKEYPENIKKKIDELEFKIETEALSTDKEKSVMKKIKYLRKIYEQNIELKNIIDEISKVDKEIKNSRSKSDEAHKKIKNLIDVSDPGYVKFKEHSNKINNLRKEQQDAFDKFISLKNEFLKANNEIEAKLKESGEINKQLNEINSQNKIEREKRKDLELNKREKLVEEKLLTKKKLTKDDLISLQR